MKRLISKIAVLILVFVTDDVVGQEKNERTKRKRAEVEKYTIMERFEPELMLTAKERVKLKEERFAEIKRKYQILDTLDISDRKRERLMQDVLEDPFSQRLSKTFADTEFQDGNK